MDEDDEDEDEGDGDYEDLELQFFFLFRVSLTLSFQVGSRFGFIVTFLVLIFIPISRKMGMKMRTRKVTMNPKRLPTWKLSVSETRKSHQIPNLHNHRRPHLHLRHPRPYHHPRHPRHHRTVWTRKVTMNPKRLPTWKLSVSETRKRKKN
jgi:hypothetical protein